MSLVETFGNEEREWDAPLLSDGTLLAAPEDSMVVIEEVDNGIHPSQAHHLLEAMRAHAERRRLRLLITTHNPALLDALPDEAVDDAVFCYRDSKRGDIRLQRVSDIDDYPGLVARGPLGQLLSEGLIDRYAKHPLTAGQRKRMAGEWLARMGGEDR
ncbi:hypothetical protein JCM17961_38710 [Endothiovibrio diazotrophicus]